MDTKGSLQKEVQINRLLVVCFLFGIFGLVTSLVVQYGWHLPPCKLCKWQRFLVAGVGIVSLFGYWTSWKKICFHFCQILLGILVGLAAYHLLVQLGWIVDPCVISCNVNSVEAFKNLLSHPACSNSPKVLGLPLASYTLIGTVLMLAITLRKQQSRKGPLPHI